MITQKKKNTMDLLLAFRQYQNSTVKNISWKAVYEDFVRNAGAIYSQLDFSEMWLLLYSTILLTWVVLLILKKNSVVFQVCTFIIQASIILSSHSIDSFLSQYLHVVSSVRLFEQKSMQFTLYVICIPFTIITLIQMVLMIANTVQLFYGIYTMQQVIVKQQLLSELIDKRNRLEREIVRLRGNSNKELECSESHHQEAAAATAVENTTVSRNQKPSYSPARKDLYDKRNGNDCDDITVATTVSSKGVITSKLDSKQSSLSPSHATSSKGKIVSRKKKANPKNVKMIKNKHS